MGKILSLLDIFELRFDFENKLSGLALSFVLDGRPTLINRLSF